MTATNRQTGPDVLGALLLSVAVWSFSRQD